MVATIVSFEAAVDFKQRAGAHVAHTCPQS